ncbi:zinc finger CCCH domain family protein [Babesia bovis T2Bo]|uniref:zinc finger CCCH domain family protein n=1 Tax=Babesia bovis T2Bo TaxID=484906 RepID=UPI001C35CBB0|nr:zinc finger CCCH domain family protein [Babesia bovis T2Bo]KAG6440143.1 zinc finger CCCH domain family protein [Babesia bovis T2Bo]
MALDGHMLQRLSPEWQQKIRNEFQTKLKMCITDDAAAKRAADCAWQALIQGVSNRNIMSQHMHPHLGEYAGDFADWVLGFINQALLHFQSIDPDINNQGDYGITQVGIDTSAYTPQTTSQSHGLYSNAQDANTYSNAQFDRDATNQGTQVNSRSGFTTGPQETRNILNTDSWNRTTGSITSQSQNHSPNVASQQQGVTIDPLDDTLDNLIIKQKINRLQGRGNAPLGILTRSSKFSPADQVNPSSIQNHFPPVPAVPGPIKVQKLCMNFPNCTYGNNCRYIHPQGARCKNWPKCAYGPKCAFIHPPVPCKFNKACTNPLCNYQHTN